MTLRPISKNAVLKQLNRILGSAGFRNSGRLRRFLELAVERTLTGKPDHLKEYILGRDVYDRGADYDPRTDSIVRVEAARLRRKLREYYETHGRADAILITFHPGSYVPEFTRADTQPHDMSTETETPGVLSRPDPRTVVVLPFMNLSLDPEQDCFCTGITDDIINALAAISGLRVVDRTNVVALRRRRPDVHEIGRRLEAGTVVDGSVRKAGDVLRVSVKIVDSRTRRALWSKVFDRHVGDKFAIQDEITRAIADTLRVTLGFSKPVALEHGAPAIEAYAFYLKGEQAWSQLNRSGCELAIDQFTRAISLYPDYAPSHAGLAEAHAWLALWGAIRPQEAWPTTKRAALEALRLDPNLLPACTSLGLALFFFDRAWQEGLALMKKAVEFQPSYERGRQFYGNSLLAAGRFGEAVQCLEQAVHVDPLSPRTNRGLGFAYYLQRRPEESEKWLEAAIALQPEAVESRFLLGRLYLYQRRHEDALNAVLRCQTDPPGAFALALQGACFARNGDSGMAMSVLERLSEMSSTQYVDPITSAFVYLGLNDIPATLKCLKDSLEERSPFAAYLNVDPLFDEIRSDPGFSSLVSVLKFS